MARRRRSFFFDNINKKLLMDTTKNTKDVKDDIDATVVANTNVMTLADVEDKISTELSDGGYATQTYVNTANSAMKTYVDTEVAGIVNSAPSTLNTLDELAAALGDDANFATSTATSLGNRLRIDVSNQSLTGTQQTNALTNLGITATVAELNYVDGVTSNIQTQLNAKGTSNFSGSYNDLTNKPTIPTNNNQLTNGAGYQVASTWTSNATLTNRSTTTPDTAGDSQGINAHYMLSNATNKPTGTDHSLLTMSYNSNWQTQIAADWRNSGRLYVRGQNSGTWSAWNTVWDSGNDGSGSGLDADLLDGQHGSYYAAASHNHSGVYTPYDHFRHTGTGHYTSTTTSALLTEALGDDAFDSYLTAHKTGWSYAGNGNLTDAGRLTELAGTSWLWWTDNSGDNVQGNVTALCIAPNTGGSAGKVFIYNNQGSGYSPGWREVWTSASDGSGSGLDADTVDGIQGSSIMRLDASGTVPDGVIHTYECYGNIATSSGNQASLQCFNSGSGTDAFMTFHVGGDYAANLGVDGGINDLAYGGWSAGANSYRVYHAGNTPSQTITVAGIGRNAHHTGHLVGSYNSVGANSYKSNPIYTIGSNYNPTDAALSNMYGIGYSHTNASFIGLGAAGSWGMYVAADGDARIWLGGSTGQINASSNITAYASDGRLKTNVAPIENAIDKVKKIRGVTFDWVDNITSEYDFHPAAMHETGVIAQEIQEVIPDAVVTAPFNGNYARKSGVDHNFLTVDKDKIIPLLIEAIKEQQAQIEELKEMINGTPK